MSNNYSPDEFFALVIALVIALNKGSRLFMEMARIRPYRFRPIVRLPFYAARIEVAPTPKYRWFFQRALALAGFRFNSAAGFGSVIPDPSGGAG